MGKRFPVAKYRDVVKVAGKLGFCLYRQVKGSHEIWRRDSEWTSDYHIKPWFKVYEEENSSVNTK